MTVEKEIDIMEWFKLFNRFTMETYEVEEDIDRRHGVLQDEQHGIMLGLRS